MAKEWLKFRQPIYSALTANGDGTGSINLNGDYSSTPGTFYWQPGEEDFAVINRMIITIADSGTIDSGGYGNGTALTNGLRLYYKAGDTVIEELTAIPITTNIDWASHCHDLTHYTFGLGDEVITIRWTFANAGYPLVLDGPREHKIELVLNDDLSGLEAHRFIIEGYYQKRAA